MVINKTNATKLSDAYGKQPSRWIGQIVQLYTEETPYGKGVRVRPLRKPPPVPAPDPDLNRDSPDEHRTDADGSSFLDCKEARTRGGRTPGIPGAANSVRGTDLAVFLGIRTHSSLRLLLNA